MSWRVKRMWKGAVGLEVRRLSNTGRTRQTRYKIARANGEYLFVDEDELFDLTEMLDDVCDSIEEEHYATDRPD